MQTVFLIQILMLLGHLCIVDKMIAFFFRHCLHGFVIFPDPRIIRVRIQTILFPRFPYRLFKNAFCAAAARSPTMKKI